MCVTSNQHWNVMGTPKGGVHCSSELGIRIALRTLPALYATQLLWLSICKQSLKFSKGHYGRARRTAAVYSYSPGFDLDPKIVYAAWGFLCPSMQIPRKSLK
jgi:hypothetical protein